MTGVSDRLKTQPRASKRTSTLPGSSCACMLRVLRGSSAFVKHLVCILENLGRISVLFFNFGCILCIF